MRKAAKELEERLLKREGKLDVLIANAGTGGWTGVDWFEGLKQLLRKGPLHFVSRPGYKLSSVGAVTARQIPLQKSEEQSDGGAKRKKTRAEQEEEPPLGEIFCANIFGHYLLGHWLSPALTRAAEVDGGRGRLIWVSTLEAYARAFDLNDLQCLTTPLSYQSSKRLTDLLALTSELPSTQPYVKSYLSTPDSSAAPDPRDPNKRPKIYLSHPGICATPIMPLHPILVVLELLAFYIARFLGSYWHTVIAWSGATAPVWLALASTATLDGMEENEGKGKWGSLVDRWGGERAVRTEVVGWGFGGRIGEVRAKVGRWDSWVNDEKRLAEFEELGRECWARMEGLREEWERRVTKDGVEVD